MAQLTGGVQPCTGSQRHGLVPEWTGVQLSRTFIQFCEISVSASFDVFKTIVASVRFRAYIGFPESKHGFISLRIWEKYKSNLPIFQAGSNLLGNKQGTWATCVELWESRRLWNLPVDSSVGRGVFARWWINVKVSGRTLSQNLPQERKLFFLLNSTNSNWSLEEIRPWCPIYILWPALLFSGSLHLQKEFISPCIFLSGSRIFLEPKPPLKIFS